MWDCAVSLLSTFANCLHVMTTNLCFKTYFTDKRLMTWRHMQQRRLVKVFHTHLLHHNKTECLNRHPSGLEQQQCALICTSRTEPETKQRGTCPWQHGPQEWNRWGTEWPEPRVCCGTESMGKHRKRIQVIPRLREYDSIRIISLRSPWNWRGRLSAGKHEARWGSEVH